MLLRNKTAVITGCNRGIGKQILRVFAENGANIIACVRKESADFTGLLAELASKHGVEISPVYFDFSDEAGVKAASRDILASKKKIDVLVNNAGVASGAIFHMTSGAELKKVFEINFFSQLLFTQGLSRHMTRFNAGSIVNVASTAGLIGDAGMTAYGASKAALMFATKTMATEFGRFNIRVNAIAPHITKTDMFDQMDAAARTKLIDATALKRPAEASEIANVALFLASDLSSYISGQVIRVDGGMTN